MSNVTSTADSASKGVLSHPVSNCDLDTPSTTPQSGSPTSENGSNYSPQSQPFGVRPPVRTSAGAAVRQSISNLPSPPPFTPTISVEQMEAVESPAPFRMAYSGGSCGSSAQAAGMDTPGVTSAWAGSSTKAAASEDTFAFQPAPTRDSPDVQTFGAATPAASPEVPSGLQQRLLQAAQHMAASQDPDATSESSSVSRASRSSSSWRDSHGGVSPGDLLRKAKGVIERSAAIGGSSRLPRNKKKSNQLHTPLDKSIPQTTTPQNTPMDVESGQFEDQQSLLATSPPSVVAPVMTILASPTSVTPTSKGTTAVEDTAENGSPVQRISQASPADSHASEISIGSVCATPTSLLAEGDASASRRLDFSDAASDMGAATPAAAGSPSPLASNSTATELPASPMPLHRLCSEMQSPTSRRFFSENRLLEDSAADKAFTDDFTFAVPHATEPPAVVETPAASAALFTMPPAPPTPRPSIMRRAGSTMLWGLAGLGLVFLALVAVELLPPALQAPPGVWCTPDNTEACLEASRWWDQHLGKDVPGWQLVVKKASYHVQDAWRTVVQGRYPPGMAKEDAVQAILKGYDLKKLDAMSVEQAVLLFGSVSREILPQVIVAKLETAEAASALHKVEQPPPEDLLAVSSSGAAAIQDASVTAPATRSKSVAAQPPPADAAANAEAPTAAEDVGAEPMSAEVYARADAGAAADSIPADVDAVAGTVAESIAAEPASADEATITETTAGEEASSPAFTPPAAEPAVADDDAPAATEPAVVTEEAVSSAEVPIDVEGEGVIEVPVSDVSEQEHATGTGDAEAAVEVATADTDANEVQQPAAAAETAQEGDAVVEVPVTEAVGQRAAAADTTESSEKATELSELAEVAPVQETAHLPEQPTAEEQLAHATESATAQQVEEPVNEAEKAVEPSQQPTHQQTAVEELPELQAALEPEPEVAMADAVEQEQQREHEVQSDEPTMSTESTELPALRVDFVGSLTELMRSQVFQISAGITTLLAVAVAAFVYLPAMLARSMVDKPEEQPAEEGQDEAELQQQQQDTAAARTPAAASPFAAAATAAAAAGTAGGGAHAGVLSDEEGEMEGGPSTMRSEEQAGLAAGLYRLLTPVAKPPRPSFAEEEEEEEAGAGPSARATGRTPRASRSAGIAGALTRRHSTRSASQLAAAAEEDGEEVQQPASTGRRRAAPTPRGRKSMAAALQPVPEQQQADAATDEGGLLSDEEPAVRARGKRRQSAPAAGAAAAAPSGGGRRRSAAAAVDSEQAATPARVTRRSSRQL